MNDLDAVGDVIVLAGLTPQQIRRARLKVAEAATGVEDARLLLDMLGLIPSAPVVTRRWERR